MNEEIARRLLELAQILADQNANAFRIRSYRQAARTVRNLREPVKELIKREGLEGLDRLPGIGKSLARSIYQIATTGRLPMLDRLRGETDPAQLLATVPGIGSELAQRIHNDLHVDTLEELEAAAYDGRLALLEGFGEKRIAGIRDSLAARLGRIRQFTQNKSAAEPNVNEILDVDNEYRNKASQGYLPRIAPRRFNPKREAWLPILHTKRGNTHYTAIFSNTARAHQLNRTHDWVVVYYDDDHQEGQYTVVTALAGSLKGRRIVRGRESECERLFQKNNFGDSSLQVRKGPIVQTL